MRLRKRWRILLGLIALVVVLPAALLFFEPKATAGNRWKRKDYVWPAIAAEVELEEYRRNKTSD